MKKEQMNIVDRLIETVPNQIKNKKLLYYKNCLCALKEKDYTKFTENYDLLDKNFHSIFAQITNGPFKSYVTKSLHFHLSASAKYSIFRNIKDFSEKNKDYIYLLFYNSFSGYGIIMIPYPWRIEIYDKPSLYLKKGKTLYKKEDFFTHVPKKKYVNLFVPDIYKKNFTIRKKIGGFRLPDNVIYVRLTDPGKKKEFLYKKPKGFGYGLKIDKDQNVKTDNEFVSMFEHNLLSIREIREFSKLENIKLSLNDGSKYYENYFSLNGH